MTQLHETIMGRRLIENTLPEMVKQLKRIADSMEKKESPKERVTVYYNHVFISGGPEEPNEVYSNCPFVVLPKEYAEELCNARIESREWDAYLIPAMSSKKVIYHPNKLD